eukprot:Seg670.8 transcript_id=Seg670.8/GoldUCD/mRNA.D3Y31 product="Cytoplasmic dynein 1 heavy chain 1" protein_id=Seg670.8/GoldUCD/D3Y31
MPEGDKMIPSVEKKIAELEMGLLHLQQNIDIPEITLTFHPFVVSIVKKCNGEGRKPTPEDFSDKVEDSTFLNALQHGVNRWIREIQKVTKLDRDYSSGTALQEISFWLNLEKALQRIQEKRDSQEVTLTLDILKYAKRFHATVSFDSDTGLKHALATVNDYNPLMKDFPLEELLSATELSRIRSALISIFLHMRKIRSTRYPVQRALRLIEAISRDLSAQFLKVVGTRKLMLMNYEEFEKVMANCFDVFNTWDDEYEKLQSLLRDIAKKKREETLKMAWRINPSHKKLQDRLTQIRVFRRQHEQLRAVIMRVLRPASSETGSSGSRKENRKSKDEEAMIDMADANAVNEVDMAYDNMKEVDGLDVSKEGTELWELSVKRYDERIDRVETRITSRLRDQLGTAKNANEMFRIFSRFNALFVRPRIRGAIREYQTQLIQRVKDDIETLHDKFKVQFPHSKACRMSKVRDLPPISGSIIWARQIESQLKAYLRRVEDVLGKDWENHVEGQRLKADGDSFRQKLSTQELFDDWSQQVRNCKWLGFRVPLAIVRQANDANQYYPFAISLIESVRTYDMTNDKVTEKNSMAPLVAGVKKDIQGLINEGGNLDWQSYKLMPYVLRLSESVTNYQEKVDELIASIEKIDIEVRSLESCAYKRETFDEILGKVQKAVDDLNLHSYSNLSSWVKSLDEEVEKRLVCRLQAGIKAWIQCLKGDIVDFMDDTDAALLRAGGRPEIKTLRHEFRIQNQVIHMHPPVEKTREHLYNELSTWTGTITGLPRIQSQRYQVGIERGDSEGEQTYHKLLTKITDAAGTVAEAYGAIQVLVKDVEGYSQTWLNYQALWDMEMSAIVDRMDSLESWMSLLTQIRESRVTFDTSDTKKTFGPIVIDYTAVQSKVNLKYDNIQKSVLTQFGSHLGDNMNDFYTNIAKAREELEQQSLEVATTGEAVSFITDVQTLKRKIKNWERQVETYRDGQKILEKQRFQFPSNWLYADNVDGEWGAFNEILKRKDASIQTQVASLQMKIVSEDQVVETRTSDLLGEWEKGKPISGSTKPDSALSSLAIYEGKFSRLKEDRDNVAKAKEALELVDPGTVAPSDERVIVALEELQDLKSVWVELSKIWEQMDGQKDQPWLSIQPRKLRQFLDGVATQLKNLPSRMRQYAAYEYLQKVIKSHQKINVLIVELKSEALKERHWKQLMRRLRVNWVLSDLTLGQIWDADMQKNETIVRDIINVAQGEMALEEFLKQVREAWQGYELELTNYQNKCKLIKGWDDLFEKVKEHINSVSAMKLSPYYKVFEEDAVQWEDKLNRILTLFDVWIDVQRRWVYLDGIFSGSGDIQHLLPIETQRFHSISTEFLALMKKVAKSPLVMDVLNIPAVQRSLERLADLLGKIQKALGEYLERERASFPRFYFVGDEDLLEIIGNSKNVSRLQKHFKKMFAGVTSIIIDEEKALITGICSKEGEEVLFTTPVSLKENPKINEWLTMVETQMRLTLANLLAQSVKDIQEFSSAQIGPQSYLKWVDSYQAQLVVLSAQVVWSENCDSALQQIEKAGNSDMTPMENVLKIVEATLNVLADSVLQEQPPVRRRKLEHLITELVHQRDVSRLLINCKSSSPRSFDWLCQMRFYYDPKQKDVLQQLSIRMANACFNYGFEYLGVQDKLVQTPLTDRCYLTMTQALEARLGGSPFGPAGTGKTESVKALGNQLGRFVLVFNCDETFDFQAMGRIFVGLCQVGAWGCFDEFNRLEERILSAVSQQVQTIQEALKEFSQEDDKCLAVL